MTQPPYSEKGSWILAKMGKKVLRPGGKELTLALIHKLRINQQDSVVEFAPGIGWTAKRILQQQPKQYFGIELNAQAAQRLNHGISSPSSQIIQTSAAHTNLPDQSVDKVIGEAMLTMQSKNQKLAITREAYRILKPKGYYAIHEIALQPDEIDTSLKNEIQKKMSHTSKLNARPLTSEEWCDLLKESGFQIISIERRPMALMKLSRIIVDEGLLGTLKIAFNILTHPQERTQVLTIRKLFSTYKKNMNAIAIIAQK